MKIRKAKKSGNKRWMLDCGEVMGKRQRLFFETEEGAIAAMKARKLILQRNGEEALAMPTPTRLEYIAAEERLKKLGITIMQAVLFCETHWHQARPIPLKDAIGQCVAAKESSGKRKVYTKALRRSLDSLGEVCTGKTNDVTQSQIEQWARTGKNGKVSLATVRSRLIDAKTLFNFCIRRKWVLESPCKGIEPVQLEEKPPGIHTVTEAKTLLAYALKYDAASIGYLAPIYFGGLRPSESQKLSKDDVHENHIEIQGPKGKSRKRRFVPINETLKAWLAVSGVKFGMSPRSRRLLRLRRIIKRKTKKEFPWPHDVLRHSFCSYALPIYGATKTAEWAGHSEQILFAHYRERVKPEDAEKYWGLRPK